MGLTDSTSTSGCFLCILGSHAFVPISWACKIKQLFPIAGMKLNIYRLMQDCELRVFQQ